MTGEKPSLDDRPAALVRRPVPSVHPRWLFVPALLLLLLWPSCSTFYARAWLQVTGGLTAARQAEFHASNRELFALVRLPDGVALGHVSEGHTLGGWGGEERVVSVTTGFRLVVPVGSETIDAWRAAHPNAGGPHPGLDVAFDTDVYEPVWEVNDAVAAEFERLGFEVVEDSWPTSSAKDRRLQLRRDGVTVSFGGDYPGSNVFVQRDW